MPEAATVRAIEAAEKSSVVSLYVTMVDYSKWKDIEVRQELGVAATVG